MMEQALAQFAWAWAPGALTWVWAWLVKGSAFLALLFLLAALLRRASASARHWLWSVGLTVALALPLAFSSLPRWQIELPSALARLSPAAGIQDAQVADKTRSVSNQAAEAVGARAVGDMEAAAPLAVAHSTAGDAAPTGAGSVSPAMRWSAPDVARLLTLVWSAIALLLFLRLGRSVLGTRRLVRHGTPVRDPVWNRALLEICDRLGLSYCPRLLTSREVSLPLTCGMLRPAIVLPAGSVDWSAARRDAVLSHELAHVRRRDLLSHLVGHATCALYWFNPLAWRAARRLRAESERSCDDLVLSLGTRASAYADQLLQIATAGHAANAPIAALPMAQPREFEARLLSILAPGVRRGSLERWQALGLVALVLVCAAPLIALTPVASVSPGPWAARGVADKSAGTIREAISVGDADRVEGQREGTAPTLYAEDGDRSAAEAEATALGGATWVSQAAGTICAWPADANISSSNTNVNDDRATITIVADDCELSVRARGDVRFSADDRTVESLGIDSWFEIEERNRAERRRAEFERRNGELVRRWYVSGREQAWDRAADEWLQGALLVMFRRTSYGAQERAARIYARGGASAVLAEARLTHSSSAIRHLYLTVIRRQARLAPATARQIARDAERISSSSNRAEILRAVLSRADLDDEVRAAVIASSSTISSSSARAEVLLSAVRAAPLTPTLADAVITSAASISSSSAKGEVLRAVGEQLPAGRPLPASYVRAASGISSSSELAQVLLTLLDRDQISPDLLRSVLDVAGQISSSSARGEVLRAVVERRRLGDATRNAFFQAVDGISSSSEREQTLSALIATHRDAATLLAAVRSAGRISSSSSRGNVLVQIAGVPGRSTEVTEAIVRAANTIGSSSERQRVLRAVGVI